MILHGINIQKWSTKVTEITVDSFGQVVEFAELPGRVFRHTQSCPCVPFSEKHEADTAPSHDKKAVSFKNKI